MIFRSLLFLALSIAFCTPLSAATGIGVGLTGGVTLTWSNLTTAADGPSTEFIGGLIAEIPVYSILSARTGILYRRESTAFGPITRTDINGNDLGTGYFYQKFTWFEIPVMAKVTLSSSPLHPYALAGISASFLNRAVFESDDAVSITDTPIENTGEFRNTVGVTMGAGAAYAVAGFAEVFIEGRYTIPLSDIRPEAGWKNSSLALTTGLQVRL